MNNSSLEIIKKLKIIVPYIITENLKAYIFKGYI